MSAEILDSECGEIIERLRPAMPDLLARHGVTGLSLFGSRSRGGAHSASDVDLLVEFNRAPGFFQFVALEDELGQLLGLKVDLVMRSALRPRIGLRVLAEAVPV